MKRILLFTIMIVMGLSSFAQSPGRLISFQPAYPIAIGELSFPNGLSVSNNGMDLTDIEQDSLPRFEIGHIYSQTVRYSENGHGFYIKADSLHPHVVRYSYEIEKQPEGTIEFNETTGRFKYYPTVDEFQTFTITFSADNDVNSIEERVVFNFMPPLVNEAHAIESQGVMPSTSDYTLITETYISKKINNEVRTAYSYEVLGKDVVFDNSIHNKVWGLSGREDIYQLNIYAEKLVIRSALAFPQTNIAIYAKELVFEDKNGEIASISTTPSPISTVSNGQGQSGGDAGDISLNLKEFKGNPAIRFILNGAKGQDTNRNGSPGNGGNGGRITSTIDVKSFCDFMRGGCGVKYDTAESNAQSGVSVLGFGKTGESGCFEINNNPHAYLHPYYISAVILHANDAFINNHTDYVLNICRDYKSEIEAYMNSEAWSDGNKELENELRNNLTEIDDKLLKLEQGLDYFGNPVGWTPLLSFEVTLQNFNDEIDRSIPTLYMYYWLNKMDQTIQRKIESCQHDAAEREKEITKLQNNVNNLVAELPMLQDEAEEIVSRINSLYNKVEFLQYQLLSKAKKNVKKKNRINKAVNIIKSIANIIPVFGSVGSDFSSMASTFFSSAIGGDFASVTGFDYSSILSVLQSASAEDNTLNTLSTALKDLPDSISKGFEAFDNCYKTIRDAVTPLYSKIQNLNNLLSKSCASSEQIQAEFNRLKSESAEWQSVEAELNELNQKQGMLQERINTNLSGISTSIADISNNVLALDAYRRDAFNGNSSRDINAMLYIEKMEQKAKNRLQKYHYYLRKAYEYRLLKPYEGEFNLVGMFDRLENLSSSLDMAANDGTYSSLASIFREVISEMAEKVIDEYSVNYPEQSAPISIVIPKKQLETINANGELVLNFHDLGIFSPDEENVRIVDMGFQHIETHVEGNVGYSGYMDLNMTHSGISRFRKDGQLYWFNHMSNSSNSPHTWGIRYDAISKESTQIKPSAASASLLYSIIGNNDIMLFSRPSAWSDIILAKKVHTNGGADIVIDSLVLKLQYDFIRRPERIRNIDISVSDGLLARIACSTADVNGNRDGDGYLYRSYTSSSQPVTFTAVEKYGDYYFANWTDRMGNIVSDKANLEVNRTKDQIYTANYERRVPILGVADTIYVKKAGGSFKVSVENVGSGDTEMDWVVSDSISTWVHIEGVSEGVDNGVFSISCDANTTGKDRVDSLEIFAPETDMMVKTIYVKQDNINDVPTVLEKVEVNENQASSEQEAIYNLSGQKVIRPRKGVYILNRKKVVIE